MEKKLLKLQNKIKYKFKNISLLKYSITHKSSNSIYNYEKSEFLGDRVLGLVISKKLISLYPNEKVGILDKKLKLDEYIITGNKKNKNSSIQKKIISDTIEALIGAIYTDSGLLTAKNFILKHWDNYIIKSNITQIDSKTRLQEYSLKKYKELPIYKLISNTGPRHNPLFKVAVKLKNTKFIEGLGSSKKNAEQSAATKLFDIYKDELAG